MPHELISRQDSRYIPFSRHPEKVSILDFEVYKYVEPHEMDKFIKKLSERNPLKEYDEILVNLRGGLELFKDLARLQGYRRYPRFTEVHRTDSGVSITKPIDRDLIHKKVLLVDDILDRGFTIQEIFRNLGIDSRGVTAVAKLDIVGQILDPRVDSAVILDNEWFGGKGMDMGLKGEKELFRQSRGIYVKIQE